MARKTNYFIPHKNLMFEVSANEALAKRLGSQPFQQNEASYYEPL